MVLPHEPHEPHEPHGPLEPSAESTQQRAEEQWPLSAEGLAGKPSWVQGLPEPSERDVNLMRALERLRLAELLDLDRSIREVWASLVETGADADTIVLFISDNGNAMLDDGRPPMASKNHPYDLSSKVPLLAFGPGFTPGATIDVPVSVGVDMAATAVAVGRATPSLALHGTSLLSIPDRRPVGGRPCARPPPPTVDDEPAVPRWA